MDQGKGTNKDNTVMLPSVSERTETSVTLCCTLRLFLFMTTSFYQPTIEYDNVAGKKHASVLTQDVEVMSSFTSPLTLQGVSETKASCKQRLLVNTSVFCTSLNIFTKSPIILLSAPGKEKKDEWQMKN